MDDADLAEYMRALNPHQLMDAIGLMAQRWGRYSTLRVPKFRDRPLILDLVNFSSAIFDDPLPIKDVLHLFGFEPGYGSVAGNVEAGAAIARLERQRVQTFRQYASTRGISLGDAPRQDDFVVQTTHGATGGIHLTLLAACMRARRLGQAHRQRIVYAAPTYALADAFCTVTGFKPVPVTSNRSDWGLPTPEEVAAALDPEAIACVVTLPANPTMDCWNSPDEIRQFRQLLLRARALDVTVIVDTIFQDVASEAPIPEIAALCPPGLTFAKVFSPSKDRPLACGYRAGYVVATADLAADLEDAKAGATSSSATHSQFWLALDSVLRSALAVHHFPAESCSLLSGTYLFGYKGPNYTPSEIAEKLDQGNIWENYRTRVAKFNAEIRRGSDELCDTIENCKTLRLRSRPKVGNVVCVFVDSNTGYRDSIELALDLAGELNIIASPPEAFGVNCIDRSLGFRIAYAAWDLSVMKAALMEVDAYCSFRIHGRK